MSDQTDSKRMKSTRIRAGSPAAGITPTRLNPAAPAQPDSLSSDHLILGCYRPASRLAVASGEADLFLCRDQAGTECVAKIYRRADAVSPEILQSLSAVRSPHVVPILEWGLEGDRPVIILPYFRRGSLEGKTFSLEELRKTVIPSVNEGLRSLHERDILHRDIKPSNLMLADDGSSVMISDFGISTRLRGGATVTSTSRGFSVSYSAPETLRGEYSLIYSDYYSLGITLYELFTGSLPFALRPEEAALGRISFPDGFPGELKDLILGLTYSDLTRRHEEGCPDCRWCHREVERWLAGEHLPVPGASLVSAAPAGGKAPLPGEIRLARPYSFGGRMLGTVRELAAAFGASWQEGMKHVGRGLLSGAFRSQGETDLASMVLDCEEAGVSDLAYFRLLRRLDPRSPGFFWLGEHYATPADMARRVLADPELAARWMSQIRDFASWCAIALEGDGDRIGLLEKAREFSEAGGADLLSSLLNFCLCLADGDPEILCLHPLARGGDGQGAGRRSFQELREYLAEGDFASRAFLEFSCRGFPFLEACSRLLFADPAAGFLEHGRRFRQWIREHREDLDLGPFLELMGREDLAKLGIAVVSGFTSYRQIRAASPEPIQILYFQSLPPGFFDGSRDQIIEPVIRLDPGIRDLSYMFADCACLEKAPSLATGQVERMKGMFQNCCALKEVPCYDTSAVRSMDQMFSGCVSLTRIPEFAFQEPISLKGMLRDCRELVSRIGELPGFLRKADPDLLFSGESEGEDPDDAAGGREAGELRFLFRHRFADFQERAARADADEFARGPLVILRNWFAHHYPALLPPNAEQARIILAPGTSTLVTARAGSGKTTLLVYLVLFLMGHRGVEPGQILMLAFNKSAAVLLKERLFRYLAGEEAWGRFQEILGRQGAAAIQQREAVLESSLRISGIVLPHVMTFHALAYRIVRPTEEQFVLTEATSSLNPRILDLVIRTRLEGPEMLKDYLRLMFGLFSEGEQGGGTWFTAGGFRVDSIGDMRIANTLYLYRLPYIYQSTADQGRKCFRLEMDPEHPVFVKGWEGPLGFTSGASGGKILEATAAGFPVITLDPGDGGSFCLAPEREQELCRLLLEVAPLRLSRRPEADIFRDAKGPRERMLNNFILLTVIARQRRMTPEELAVQIRKESFDRDQPGERRLFNRLFLDFFTAYGELLEKHDCYDFVRMFAVAEEKLEGDFGLNWFTRRLTHIMVDEFQDFSRIYYDLIQCVCRRCETPPSLLAVGDDWQAINGFAGAELRFFQDFTVYFPGSQRMSMLANYRSARSIVELGNSLMEELGEPARAIREEEGRVQLYTAPEFTGPGARISLERICNLARYIVRNRLEGESVVVLTRTRGEMQELKPQLEPLGVEIRTVHTYKGSEADHVILDVNNWFFPLIHPDSVYQSLVGIDEKQIVQEERRLLYVGVTRARSRLYLVADTPETISYFIMGCGYDFEEISEELVLETLAGDDMALRQRITVVLSGNTFPFRNQLRALGFVFQPEERRWSRRYDSREQAIRAMGRILPLEADVIVRCYDYRNRLMNVAEFR